MSLITSQRLRPNPRVILRQEVSVNEPATVALSRLTEEILLGLRPGDRVILTAHGRPLAEVVPLSAPTAVRSVRHLGGALREFARDFAASDASIEEAVRELDQETHGRG
jgi:antitoxin (DNA-binding transcriptional repressor) of toxin-antitoxin stability system